MKTCIRDYCGQPFDPSVPETRDTSTLRAFWMRYCPEHRLAPEGQTIITEVRATNQNCACRYSSGDFIFCPMHSAASELLEACKAILYWTESRTEALRLVSKAIAKAEGKD